MTAQERPLPALSDPLGIFALQRDHALYIGDEAAARYFGLRAREDLIAVWQAAGRPQPPAQAAS